MAAKFETGSQDSSCHTAVCVYRYVLWLILSLICGDLLCFLSVKQPNYFFLRRIVVFRVELHLHPTKIPILEQIFLNWYYIEQILINIYVYN